MSCKTEFVPRNRLLFAAILISGMLFAASLKSQLPAQDHGLYRLPRRAGIYFWTNDAGELLSRVRDVVGVEHDMQRGDDRTSEDDQPEDSESAASLYIQRFIDVLDRLGEEEVFEDDAILILPVSDPRTYLSIESPRERLGIAEPLLVARTSASSEELLELFQSIERSWREDERLKELGEDGSVTAEPRVSETFGAWDCQGGWFCWTSSEEQTAETLAYLAGDESTSDSLADDRDFQNAIRHLQGQLSVAPTCSFYVTKESLPIVGGIARGELPSMIMAGLDLGWRGWSLHEMRGLVGRVYLADPKFKHELDSPFAIDAFLSVTQPRHGILRGLGRPDNESIDFSAPHRNRPLKQFIQFVVDGEELVLGVQETRSKNNIGSSSDELMLPRLIRISQTLHLPEDNDPWNADLLPNVLMQFDDGGETVERVLERGDLYEEKSIRDFFPQLSLDVASDMRAWSYSDAVFEDLHRRFTERSEEVRQEINELDASDGVISERSRRTFEQELEVLRFNLEMVLRMKEGPQAVLVKDWLIQLPRDYLEVMADSLDEPHSQLAELESLTDRMGKVFANREPYCGVAAAWFPHIRSRLQPKPHPASNQPAGTKQERETDSPAPIPASVEVMIARRFIDMVVVTISSSEDGFRINGMLTKPAPDEE